MKSLLFWSTLFNEVWDPQIMHLKPQDTKQSKNRPARMVSYVFPTASSFGWENKEPRVRSYSVPLLRLTIECVRKLLIVELESIRICSTHPEIEAETDTHVVCQTINSRIGIDKIRI